MPQAPVTEIGYRRRSTTPGRIDARKNLRGMRVIIPADANETEWTVLERAPRPGHWWLHRYDELGTWVTCEARYSHLVQVID